MGWGGRCDGGVSNELDYMSQISPNAECLME